MDDALTLDDLVDELTRQGADALAQLEANRLDVDDLAELTRQGLDAAAQLGG